MDKNKELFLNKCFAPNWTEIEDKVVEETPIHRVLQVRQRKDLKTLIAELDEIEDTIQTIAAKQWELERLVKFHENR